MEKHINQKGGFIFYRSYFEAIETLSKKNQLLAYEAIVRYALNQEVVENLPLRVLAILKIAMPNIDANIRKYNKKVGRAQNNMSDFEKVSEEKILLPRKDNTLITSSDFIEDYNYELEE